MLSAYTCKYRIFAAIGGATHLPMTCRYGVVLRKSGSSTEAAAVLLESVKKYEYNWSAWMELSTLVITKKNVLYLLLPFWIRDSLVC